MKDDYVKSWKEEPNFMMFSRKDNNKGLEISSDVLGTSEVELIFSATAMETT